MVATPCRNCGDIFEKPRGQTLMCPPCRATHKWCKPCGKMLPLTEFGPSKSRGSTHQAYCRACSSDKARQWSKENSERRNATRRASYTPDRGRRAHVRQMYGLAPDAYDAMLEQQDGKCAICGLVPEDTLHVDHDHTTGAVRSLLCGRCNTGLGLFREDPSRLSAALTYLREHQPRKD